MRLPGYKGRDRTFFFGYYEGFRYVRSANSITTVPTAGNGERRFFSGGTSDDLRHHHHDAGCQSLERLSS